MSATRYAAEHIIVNGHANRTKWIDRYFIEESDYQSVCRDAVAMAKMVQELEESVVRGLWEGELEEAGIQEVLRSGPKWQAAQRVIAAYGEDGI
jgi:hypothetical protein